ncbi:MAG TPA: hypothetical protein VMM18_06275 [Gemmatimonadaceae bacterium]|nr:hypothetical protein [Gemmatimonadaceae bacterium]
MGHRPSRSLKHEYELFVEREIENYKESVPRSALLAIGDEAVAALASQSQLALTELLLCEEVDRIIRARLRLPAYQGWRRRRLKELEQLRRPEYWGLTPDHVLVRELRPTAESRVLVAGMAAGESALFLAANGCDVTAVDEEIETLRRVLDAAEAVGLADRIQGTAGGLSAWTPGEPLFAVVCSADALAALSRPERERVFEVLKSATRDGGVHLVEAIALGANAPSLDELRTRYSGWSVSVERSDDGPTTFLARKAVA